MSQESSPLASKSVSLLGCGWLGIALAHALLARGCKVRGSTTHPSRVASLRSIGIEPLLLRIEPVDESIDTASNSSHDQVLPDDSAAFFSSDCLVINIPPEAALGPDYHPSQIESILGMIARNPTPPRQIVYVSSTSVYGAQQGHVDESTPPNPDRGSGEILLATEQRLARYAHERCVGLTVIRPGGFIGPGRHPGLFLAGRRDVTNGSTPLNMIHQTDLCELIACLIAEHPAELGTTEIYNAVSQHHPSRAEYYPQAAASIGVEPPTFAASVDSNTAHAKIVSSDKIRRVTGYLTRFDDLYQAIGANTPSSASLSTAGTQ